MKLVAKQKPSHTSLLATHLTKVQVGKSRMKTKPRALHWLQLATALEGRLPQPSRLAVSKLQIFFGRTENISTR
jgi:hypothetical protein